jgi:hypothetical protein
MEKGGLNLSYSLAWQGAAADSLRALVERNMHYIDENIRRLKLMQHIYLEENAHLYTNDHEVEQIQYYADVVSYKYWLASISIEQLQAVRHSRIDEGILSALENSLDRLDCSDDDRLVVSFALECFLFQAMAFLDLYMIHVCLLLRTGHRGSMRRRVFYRELSNAQQGPFADKAGWVEEYFRSKVFGATYKPASWVREDWGCLVESLRDRIAHRDRVRPSFDSQETLINSVLLDWPTLQKMTYHSLCEMLRAGMYYLFYDVSAFLYDLEWDTLPQPEL